MGQFFVRLQMCCGMCVILTSWVNCWNENCYWWLRWLLGRGVSLHACSCSAACWVIQCLMSWKLAELDLRDVTERRQNWWDCVKKGVKSFGLSQGSAQDWNKWRYKVTGTEGRDWRGQLLIQFHHDNDTDCMHACAFQNNVPVRSVTVMSTEYISLSTVMM